MKLTDRDTLKRMVTSRPGDLGAIFARRIKERLSTPPTGMATTHFGGVRYDVDMSLHALTRKYYFHTHEPFLESVFRKFLKPGDTFIDAGANMGYWSAFSACLVGKTGALHAFEPVPRFFASVARLAALNPDFTIIANNMALGEKPGSLPMQVVEPTADNYDNMWTNIGSSSMTPGLLDAKSTLISTIDVEVTTFDLYAAKANIDLDRIGLMKIDVEGFERFVFAGMRTMMEKPGRKVPILCELLTDLSLNLNGAEMVRLIESFGYRCLDALTMAPIDKSAMRSEENVVCV